MCISPITIENPRYGLSRVGLNQYKNCETSRISVPCGKCFQCIAQRQGFFNQRVQMESLRSHLFMFTLTYNDESLRFTDIGDYKVAYPEFKDVQDMFKRLRKLGFKFSYTFCSEYGTVRHRPHFHGIIAVRKTSNKHWSLIESDLKQAFFNEWRRNYGSTRSPFWSKLFTFHRKFTKSGIKQNFDFHYIQPVQDHDNDCSFYISKYLTKHDKRTTSLLQKISLDESLSLEEKSFLSFLIKPRSFTSKDFGSKHDPLIKHHIIKNLSFFNNIPQFCDISTGKTSMLSPYYMSIVPLEFYADRWLNSDYVHIFDSYFVPSTNSPLDDYQDFISKDIGISRFEKSINLLNKRLDDSFF